MDDVTVTAGASIPSKVLEEVLRIVSLLIGLTLLVFPAHSQGLPIRGTLLDEGYRQMYNLQFENAHRSFQEWQRLHPDDPLAAVSEGAAYLFSEFERLHILDAEFFLDDDQFLNRTKPQPDGMVKQLFDSALGKSQQLSDRTLGRAPEDRNAAFASILRLGLRSDYLALIEKKNLAALSDVKNGRVLAEKLVASDPGYSDAYLAIGVENYLLSLKPLPVRWFLRITGAQTDKTEGLRKVAITAERGHYLQPFARVLLAVAALRDKNMTRAKEILDSLSKEFPGNRLYAQQAARLR